MKETIKPILALIIVLGGLFILCYQQPQNDVKIALVGLMGTIVGYYFGGAHKPTDKM